MTRFSRINTIWRKELVDTLRDRRTLIAMILVPMVLYPAMILGSLQGFEYQVSRLQQEEYVVAVLSEPVRIWLRHMLDSDAARQPGVDPNAPAEVLVEQEARGELAGPEEDGEVAESPTEAAQARMVRQPPAYRIEIIGDFDLMQAEIRAGRAHAGLLLNRQVPTAEGADSAEVLLLMDQTEIRSQMAANGLRGVFERAGEALLRERLARVNLTTAFIEPISLRQETVATPAKVGGSILGQIVPLILIIMTITGAIYPAIDLTAGERERGTLETLMVAPVPTVDLIAGKFVVVALIGMLSATLNLLSIGGTVYLGGLGQLLSRGGEVEIPLAALPWVLLVLVPLAVMFSAILLAVCSFARSFKEAQNYVMPVMMAALIPAVVGVLPGMKLQGPLLIMPVTNITILTRDLFTGQFEVTAIVWVTLSTTLYAGAAVAVAAKLFGQEAVLFADSGSIRTLFQRRFFKPRPRPSAAHAFLLLALLFSLNFFAQQTFLNTEGTLGTMRYWWGLAGIIVVLFVLVPLAMTLYARADVGQTFGLRAPPVRGVAAAVCIGLTSWIVATAWAGFQRQFLPMPAEMEHAYEQLARAFKDVNPWVIVFFAAVVPGVCEELFFRGYALGGLRGAIGKVAAVLVVAFAFGVYHFSVHRLVITAGLGVLFGLLVVQYRSIWPAVIAHMLNNGLFILSERADGLKPVLEGWGYTLSEAGYPPVAWLLGAGAVLAGGVLLGVVAPDRESALESAALNLDNGEVVPRGGER